ncbi:uncharacterized protein LOC120633636 [Pararge aegeria]|nr:uncharacterized protein LOC120633636 [Pararge aegeria]
MAHRNDYQRLGLGQRMSEEFQLLAEEKWIVETLAKIKNQRNCLQIERLHLENLKAKLKPGSSRKIPATPQVQIQVQPEPMASTSVINLMQNASVKSSRPQNEFVEKKLDDATCYEEELDLVVTNPGFNRDIDMDFNMEEDDEESDDNDMFIDMNMLMNGVFK